MKVSRRQLKRLIQEAMYDPRTLPKDYIPRSMIADDEHKDVLQQLSTGGEESYNQAAFLAEPPAVIDMAGGYQGALKKADRMRDHEFFDAMRNRERENLDAYGFDYYVEVIDPAGDYQDFGPMIRFHAEALGCQIEDLAYVGEEGYNAGDQPGERGHGTYDKIINTILNNRIRGSDIPGDQGHFGYNQMYNVRGINMIYNNNYGYKTFTICG